MSGGSGASSIEALNRFKVIWHVDFEFRQDGDHCPVPVCMFAKEQRSGAEIFLNREQLLALRGAPFDVGPESLMIAYMSAAELSCFLSLQWSFPRNIVDPYVETITTINGHKDIWPGKGRPGLLAALELFGLPGSASAVEKTAMRDLILNQETYTAEQFERIRLYNRGDVIDTLALLPALLPTLDLPRALHRGRYMAAVAKQETIGLPVDTDRLNRLLANWERLQRHYIAQDDEFGLYDDLSFREQRMWDLIGAKRWDWPHTPSGKFALDQKTLGRQAKRYPELRRLVRLRENIAELRISKLANTVGRDGFSRCPLLPFWTKTSRNQPSGDDKIFLPALPAWLHGILRPPPGWTLLEFDWSAQEFAIAAGLSGDEAMIADYHSGDPYWAFGLRADLVSPEADARMHQEFRDKILKPLSLGPNYGMTPYGIAAKTGRSLLWARDAYARHQKTYATFNKWRDDVVAQAKFDRMITSPFGWPMAVTGDTGHRTLMNFPVQAAAADAMRIAAIAATEARIPVCVTVHDAFWVLARDTEVEGTIEAMRDIMTKAGAAVCGLPIRAKKAAMVTSSRNFGDTRTAGDKGFEMWDEVKGLLDGGLEKQRQA
jgi:hypothetical protein